MPAEMQITAEQILREAKERELELVAPVSQSNFYYLYVCIVFVAFIFSPHKIGKVFSLMEHIAN